MHFKPQLFHVFLFLFLFSGCSLKQSSKTNNSDSGDAVKLSHATLFEIRHSGDYTIVSVLNPWKNGDVYDRYYLVKDPAVSVPADGYKIQIPIKSLMANSATHLGFLEALDELDKVTGVCNANFIYNPYIRNRVEEGKVKDLGDSFNLDVEQLMLLRPQAVMTTAYNADDENSKKLRQTGLSIIYNIEWQEKTLLGRAEWVKFIGAFFDKGKEADSIFSAVEQQYMETKQKVDSVENKPSILSGQEFRGSWSMPGGKSFNARLYLDAGGDYYFKDDSTTGSISTTIEEALVYFNNANVWIGAQANTLEELGKVNPQYKLFKAYRNGNVYNMNKRQHATGGSDYWESGVARPDLILIDIIKILHPDILADYEFTYFRKLEE